MKNRDKAKILIVDDSPATLEVLERNLTARNYRVFTAPGVAEGLNVLENTDIDLVITDLKMPGGNGMNLVRHVRENLKDTAVMMITGYATVNGAVKAMKQGAEEYLAKPFTDEELIDAVGKILDKLKRRRSRKESDEEPDAGYPGLKGKSAPIKKIYGAIDKAASTDATVLLFGESGTGKELVARAIHYKSKRSSAPFVPVNCGGIPESLLESELFGHLKGAFTGASETRAGFFQTADGGTIFLDEISNTSLSMQAKLLRVLQDKQVFMVGADKPRKVDIRILAATNKDLSEMVEKGTFRQDLFYRINVINISVPPLRERKDDILLLAEYFAAEFAEDSGKKKPEFTEKALEAFLNYSWPGNVRELRNTIQRLIVMTEGDRIDIPDLPSHMRFSASGRLGLDRTLAEVEAEHIKNVLADCGGNKTRAAEILGIDRKTLREKLKKRN